MVNEIVNGISIALHDVFPNARIYIDELEQGYTEPCFFIMLLHGSENRLLGARAKRLVSFDIHYFAHGGNIEREVVANTLYRILRQITMVDGSKLNGMFMRHQIADEVLHFFVEYRPIIYYTQNERPEKMEEIETEVGVHEKDQ